MRREERKCKITRSNHNSIETRKPKQVQDVHAAYQGPMPEGREMPDRERERERGRSLKSCPLPTAPMAKIDNECAPKWSTRDSVPHWDSPYRLLPLSLFLFLSLYLSLFLSASVCMSACHL